jgi:hypothetical protein
METLILLNLGLSDGRSNMQQQVTFDDVEKEVRLFIENMDNAMIAWEDIRPQDKAYNLAGIAPEARKIVGYIIRNGPSSKAAIYEHCKLEMPKAVFDRTSKSLYNGGLIYAKGTDPFDVIPHLRDSRS